MRWERSSSESAAIRSEHNRLKAANVSSDGKRKFIG